MKIKILIFYISISIVSHSQAVRIGKYVVSTEDLNVTHFNNGDEIPLFKSKEEAKKYVKEGKPACIKVGNSVWYNWYAANDKRGIAANEWYLPDKKEFDDFYDIVRISATKDMHQKFILPGKPTGIYNNNDTYFQWWVGGGIYLENDIPIVQTLKTTSVYGPLTFSTEKREDFYPIRLFVKDPENIFAPIYFTQEKEFKIDIDSLDWNIRIESNDCGWGNEVNDCFGQAKIYLTNKKDNSKIYNINVDDFNFSWDKKDKIISNLGFVFDDFNFDGQNDFGYGFDGDMFDGLLPKVYLMSQDGKRFEYNKEFNKLILGGEYSWYDLSKRTFDFVSTIGNGNEHTMTYYLCPKDSIKKFRNYEFPKELEGYKINYPNVYLVKYYNKSDSKVEKFDFFNHMAFTTKTLTEIEKGEFDESYNFNFENSDISNLVEKIDSATFYKAYENVVPNPFLLKEKAMPSELKLIKKNKASISKKRNKLTIDCSEGQIKSFDSGEEAPFNYRFYGETENQRHWLVSFSENGSCASDRVLMINKKTCSMDTIYGFPRYSPDGKLVAIGEYVEEEGAFGFLELYKIENDKLSEIGSVLMDDLEYSFAPYELFWLDNKTLFVKKLKTNGKGEKDFYFEYGKITVDYFNKFK